MAGGTPQHAALAVAVGAALLAVVLVSHREKLLEIFERQPDQSWKRSEARGGSSLRIAALDGALSVDEIYAAATLG